jgi:HEAT repeat protein
MWYQQSIGLSSVGKVKGIEGIDEDIFRLVFYFRDIEGKEAIINLSTNGIIDRSNIVDIGKLDEAINKKAASFLESDDYYVRETGALHLGYSGNAEYLSDLRSLLQDKASVVRAAAAEAIRKIKLRNGTQPGGTGQSH